MRARQEILQDIESCQHQLQFGEHNGNNSFIVNRQIPYFEAELTALDSITLSGNTLQKTEPKPEPKTVEHLRRDVPGLGLVTASLDTIDGMIQVGCQIYTERTVVVFESEKGIARYDLTCKGWLVTPGDIGWHGKLEDYFFGHLGRLAPVSDPDPEPEKPALVVVDPDEYNKCTQHIESLLSLTKGNSSYRMSAKVSDTLYAWLNREYQKAQKLGYVAALAHLQYIEVVAQVVTTPFRLWGPVTIDEFSTAEAKIWRFHR
jgi:hypothetical protein